MKTSMVPPEAYNQCCETTSFWCWSGFGFPVLMPIQIRIRIVVETMLILMRILPQDLHMSENLNFFTFSHSIASLQCFIVLISVECVIIFSILDSILKFSWNKFSLSTFPFAWKWYRSGSGKMMRIHPIWFVPGSTTLPPTLRREHPALQFIKWFFYFFIFLWVIFSFLVPGSRTLLGPVPVGTEDNT
jgi:hypothetical protein